MAEHGLRWPIACDTMAAEFATSFGAWPTRFYVLRRDTLAFKIQPQPGGVFDVAELGAWVEAFAQHRWCFRARARGLGRGGAAHMCLGYFCTR